MMAATAVSTLLSYHKQCIMLALPEDVPGLESPGCATRNPLELSNGEEYVEEGSKNKF